MTQIMPDCRNGTVLNSGVRSPVSASRGRMRTVAAMMFRTWPTPAC
jgi:hypothetical protein